MLKVILQSPRHIVPFNEAARDLRIQNKPLWLNQRDLLAPYVTHEIELAPGARLPLSHDPMIVYRDNLFFDVHYITEFMRQAKKRDRAVRAAFSVDDGAFREHALPSRFLTRRLGICITQIYGITQMVPPPTLSLW